MQTKYDEENGNWGIWVVSDGETENDLFRVSSQSVAPYDIIKDAFDELGLEKQYPDNIMVIAIKNMTTGKVINVIVEVKHKVKLSFGSSW